MNITIPLIPTTKKNHQRIVKVHGHYMVLPSKQYKDYEKACGKYIPKVDTIDYPVNLKCVYYMPTRRRTDLINLFQATADILVKYGVLKDDDYTIVHSMDGSMVLYDKENPRTEITIDRLETPPVV